MKKQLGFTLLEIMVVVVIMGMLASIVSFNVMGSKADAEVRKTRIDIKNIQQALDLYKLDNSRYPTTEQGLKALIKKPTASPVPKNWKKGGYVQELPEDPWGNKYQYANPGVHNPDSYDLYSFGPDQEEGSDDDIGNWQSEADGDDDDY
ncbi:MAG: type II secretion system major pseudopilin GspG [Succinivibrionaceae bacterium]|jgi:general secretion pathway protein G|nr:type II secretion system major pseudopilin GspG [Succinivibrionaceae bacterium]MBQ8977165.1 type II secretion system major pseudopilin GspG [Succinivibrionaceae bacterium]